LIAFTPSTKTIFMTIDIKSFSLSTIRRAAQLAALSVVIGLSACGGGESDPEPGQLTQSTVRSTPAGLPAGTTTKLMRYRMEALAGGLTEATALVFTPPGAPPAGGWPVAVWAHGTTGVADSCTPSTFTRYGDASTVAPLLAQGMVVVAPDYEGLGGAGVHPYYIRKSHALGVLRAVQAATNDPDNRLARRWGVMGHSQGGNVALAAAEEAKLIDGVSELRSVVLLAPGSDLAGTSDDLFRQVDAAQAQGDIETAALLTLFVNFNGTFVLQGAKAAEPAIDVNSYVGVRMQPLVGLALTEQPCGQFFAAISNDIGSWVRAGNTVASYPGIRRDWATEPRIAALIEANRVGKVRVTAPIQVVQGTNDEQVPVTGTRRLVAGMRALGNKVELVEIPNGDHGAAASEEVVAQKALLLRSQLVGP
jgi:acetyl esterase/lipase